MARVHEPEPTPGSAQRLIEPPREQPGDRNYNHNQDAINRVTVWWRREPLRAIVKYI